jgi:hypothetical protein
MLTPETLTTSNQDSTELEKQIIAHKGKNWSNIIFLLLVSISIVFGNLIPVLWLVDEVAQTYVDLELWIFLLVAANLITLFFGWKYISYRLKKENKSMVRLRFPRTVILLQTYIITFLILVMGSITAASTDTCRQEGCFNGFAILGNYIVFCFVFGLSLLIFIMTQKMVIREGSVVSSYYKTEILTAILFLFMCLVFGFTY